MDISGLLWSFVTLFGWRKSIFALDSVGFVLRCTWYRFGGTNLILFRLRPFFQNTILLFALPLKFYISVVFQEKLKTIDKQNFGGKTKSIIGYFGRNWPFPNRLKPLFQSEAKCKAIDKEMFFFFYPHANKTHFPSHFPSFCT